MNKFTLILILIIVGLCTFGWIGFQHYSSQIESLKTKNTELSMKADLSIGRAETVFNDPSHDITHLDKSIQQDIKTKDSKLTEYSELQAHSISSNSGTLVAAPAKCINNVLTTLPFSFQDFRLSASGDAIKKDFKYTLSQKFEVISAETQTSNGGINNYAELYELDQNNKRINKLELTKFIVSKAPLDPKRFKLWDPALDISIGGVVFRGYELALSGSLGISVMSYGRYRNLDFRFIRLGVGLDQKGINLSLSPVQYNFARPIPLINNLWIGPLIGYNIDIKQYFLGLGVAAIL